MNKLKHNKPDLINLHIQNKIQKILKPPHKDYWGPTQNFFSTLYYDYMRPHGWLLFFIFVVILCLIYRYQTIQSERLLSRYSLAHKNTYDNKLNRDELNDIMNAYHITKELSREPIKYSK